ncbi:TetR/AcrR family transcriptional regulator [Novosphingobium anseongense]|uniref:TetR/AcrR family transcriptional regulator n=1 Tax=Novosphingobium anseongense TaxID=3133436 RepID=UPI003A929B58
MRSGSALENALLRLLETKHFEEISARDICAESGVHYATFFRHHAGKETLLDDIAANEIRAAADLAPPYPRHADEAASLAALCRHVERRRDLWRVLLNGGAGSYTRQAWLKRVRTLSDAKRHAARSLPGGLAATCAAGSVIEALSWWLGQPSGTCGTRDFVPMLERICAPVLRP